MKLVYLSLFIQAKWLVYMWVWAHKSTKDTIQILKKKNLLRVSKKYNEEKCRKNVFGINFLFYLKTSSLIDSLILPFFLLFLFFFFSFILLYEFIVSLLSRFLPSFVSSLIALSRCFTRLFDVFIIWGFMKGVTVLSESRVMWEGGGRSLAPVIS